MGDYAAMMAQSDYVTGLDVEEKEFALAQADLTVKLKKTEIEVLRDFTVGRACLDIGACRFRE